MGSVVDLAVEFAAIGRETAIIGAEDIVTVWNRYYCAENGRDMFIRHVLPVLCKWRAGAKRGESRSRDNNAVAAVSKSLTVIVPYSEDYRPYDSWVALDEEGKRRFFTLHVSDLIALGRRETDITGVSPFTETEVKKALGEECAVISAFADNTGTAGTAGFGCVRTRLPRRGGHYKVGCYYGFQSRF